MGQTLAGAKARLRTMRHRGDLPWLVEPIAKAYAHAQWAQQRWQLRHYDREMWLTGHRDPERVVDFAFTGYDGAFAPIQSKHELSELAAMVQAHAPRVVLELGTARGGTFFVLTQMASSDATLISVDLPAGIGGSGYPAWKMPIFQSFATGDQSVHLIRADSHSPTTLDEVRTILGGRKVDLLFIDADHSYAGVKGDYERYSPLVRPGGVICVHDVVPNPYNDAIEVDRFWHEVSDASAIVIKDPADIPGFGIGVLVPRQTDRL
jgi:predicted O-methyltransferase YrrM